MFFLLSPFLKIIACKKKYVLKKAEPIENGSAFK